MPNWCAGTLKVRGSFVNVKKFILEGMPPVSFLGEDRKLEIATEDETTFCISEIKDDLWLRGTRRHFCNPDYIEVYADSPDETVTIALPFRAAWAIEAEKLLALCQNFDVDMKVQGFERGMEFSQIVEIVDKKIVHDEEIEYDDWTWDCPCPNLGG